jgi:hypothetical protein
MKVERPSKLKPIFRSDGFFYYLVSNLNSDIYNV